MIRENSCGGALVERPVPDARSHEPGARYIMGPEGKERSAKARSDCNGRNVRRTEGLKDGIPNRRNAWETERPASGTRVAGLRPAYVGAGKAQAESEGCPCGWKRWRRPPFCARRLRCSPQAACMWPVPPSPTILRVPRRAWRCAGRWRSPPPSSDAWRSHKDAARLQPRLSPPCCAWRPSLQDVRLRGRGVWASGRTRTSGPSARAR